MAAEDNDGDSVGSVTDSEEEAVQVFFKDHFQDFAAEGAIFM